jgi:hypothetical protein
LARSRFTEASHARLRGPRWAVLRGRLLYHPDVVAVRVAQAEHERGVRHAHRLGGDVDAADGPKRCRRASNPSFCV